MQIVEEVVAQLSIKVSAKDRPYSLLYTLFQSEHNYGLKCSSKIRHYTLVQSTDCTSAKQHFTE